MPADANHPDPLAEAVREACLEAAIAAYEDARIRGLCAEGAWECAVGAIRTLDLTTIAEAEFTFDVTRTDR